MTAPKIKTSLVLTVEFQAGFNAALGLWTLSDGYLWWAAYFVIISAWAACARVAKQNE